MTFVILCELFRKIFIENRYRITYYGNKFGQVQKAEKEVLLPRGMSFKVTDFGRFNVNCDGFDRKLFLIFLEEE